MDMNDLWYGTSGPRNAEIVLVGESWGAEEEMLSRPFQGPSGKELDRILMEAGLERRQIFCTNVIAQKPKGNDTWRFFNTYSKSQPSLRGLHPTPLVMAELDRLYRQISEIRPRLVIVCGNYALWALTECASVSSESTGDGATVRVPAGISSWRGSMLYPSSSIPVPKIPLLPIFHPAAILQQWYLRAPTLHDLRVRVKAALANDWRPLASPTILAPPEFHQATYILENWLQRAKTERIRIANDIETSRRLITCIGFADGGFSTPSALALVIPFVRLLPQRRFESFWPPDQEAILLRLMQRLLQHPNILVEGQNYLYDTQYIQHWLGVSPKLDFDTMSAHHLLFPGTPKGLDYLSSLYCRYHWYWKDDNKDWDLKADERTHLEYNGVDCLRTYECATALRALVERMGMRELWEWEKQKMALALRMMNRGINIDKQRRSQVGFELAAALGTIHNRLHYIIPRDIVKPGAPWWTSPIQQRTLFYEILGMEGQRHRKTGRPTVDDKAMKVLKRKNPEFSRIFDLLEQARSIGVFSSTFIGAELDPDGRMRCSFNTSGTETFRWSSSSNAFGRGTNLQNVPKGEEE